MREHRILRRNDFLACYGSGRRFATRQFVVFVHVRPDAAAWRTGLAVTKKLGNAVARNRIKRVLREFFRLNQDQLPQADIVVVPKKHVRAKDITLAAASAELLPVLGSARRAVSRRT